MSARLPRRLFLARLATLSLLPAAALAVAPRSDTPAQMEGPFYPIDLPLDRDNDLTRVAGQPRAAHGIVTDLSGAVLDLNGRPIKNARVEIWQCDARGFYHHPHDRGGRSDPAFQGFGHTSTDAAGRYRFRTIRPVAYPGRTPHIHAKVLLPDTAEFTTQIYIAGEPLNQRDGLFRSLPADRQHLLQATFQTTGSGQRARFDFVMASRGGTPRL
jgi:protocatechuate 3,4-dioxygenase beta subunit